MHARRPLDVKHHVRVCVIVLLSAWASLSLASEKTAAQLYKEAQKAEKAGEITKAYILYSEAALKDPANPKLWGKAQTMRPAVASPKIAIDPASAKDAAPELDSSILGSITDLDLAETRRLLPPPELKANHGTKNFDLKGDSKQLIEQVASAFGLEVVFDAGYQPKTALRLQLMDADYLDAMRAIEAATDSFAIPVSSRQLLIANDTAQKRTELDSTVAIVIPAPEPFATQELQEIATGIRGTLDIPRITVDLQRRLILIRDHMTKIRMAQKLLRDLMQPRPVVAVEVELMTTDETSSLSYGLSLPDSLALVWFGHSSILSAIHPAGFANFLGFGGGKSLIGLGVTNASLFLNVSKSSSQTVLRSEIIASDGQAATLHVGDKYPIVNNLYLGTTSSTGQSYTPPPSFTFEDLGLLLKITPHVHGMDEMTLEVESEFKLLGSQAVDGIPIISNRKFQSKVRIRNGEWAVLSGLMTESESKTISGIAGLSVVPVLRNNKGNRNRGETLIVLKPHLLNLPPTEWITNAAWVGTETRPRTAF